MENLIDHKSSALIKTTRPRSNESLEVSMLTVKLKYMYSQLPLSRTPSGPRVSVLNSESPFRNSRNLFQSNVCNIFLLGFELLSVISLFP